MIYGLTITSNGGWNDRSNSQGKCPKTDVTTQRGVNRRSGEEQRGVNRRNGEEQKRRGAEGG